jgi:hypothetical protein
MTQFSEAIMNNINKFFYEFKNSYRNQRLILLLKQLNKKLSNTSDNMESSILTSGAGDEHHSQFELGIQNNSEMITDAAVDGRTSTPPPSQPASYDKVVTSPSLDCFLHYVPTINSNLNSDKEWYYNIIRSACCNQQQQTQQQSSSSLSSSLPQQQNFQIKNSNLINHDYLSLKPKECALMLSSLDYSKRFTALCIHFGPKNAKKTHFSNMAFSIQFFM